MIIEPFGYFRPEAFGWTDCHDNDEGAQPLWDNAAMCAVEKQRDELLAALERILLCSISETKGVTRSPGAIRNAEASIASVKGGA